MDTAALSRLPSRSLNKLFPSLFGWLLRSGSPERFLIRPLNVPLPLRCHEVPIYVDITAKALGYMDVLTFYSFSGKNLISRCQRKAIFHSPWRPVYMHIDMSGVDHQNITLNFILVIYYSLKFDIRPEKFIIQL